MKLCGSKKIAAIHNNAFDLVDADGDNKVTKKELDVIADYIHTYHITQSVNMHNKLANTNPEEFLFQLLGKSSKSTLKKKDFKKLIIGIPPVLWNTKILPALRSNEIERLEILNTKVGDITDPILIPGGFIILKIENSKETKIITNISDEVEIISKERKNKQLNQFSIIYFNKIKKEILIDEF